MRKCVFLLGTSGLGAWLVCTKLKDEIKWRSIEPVSCLQAGQKCSPETKRIRVLDDPDYQLHNVQVFFRHGARTPFSDSGFQNIALPSAVWDPELFMKTLSHCDIGYTLVSSEGEAKVRPQVDPSHQRKHQLHGGCHPGVLTTVGQEQSYQLGVKLKNAYMEGRRLLSYSYQPSEIHLRSTDTQRTILSLRCCVAGLYGKENVQEPINIVHFAKEDDDLWCNYRQCGLYNAWVQNAEDHVMGLREFESDLRLLRVLLNADGSEETLSFGDVLDTANCRLAHGFHVPHDLASALPWIKKRAAQATTYVLCGLNSDKVLRLAAGKPVDLICSRICEATSSAGNPKMFLYACHDVTLLILLKCLEQNELSWPPFAAHLIFEVYRNKEGKFFVRVVYEHEPITFSSDYRSEKYSELVPLDRFLDMMKKFRAGDWERECGVELDYRHALSRGTV